MEPVRHSFAKLVLVLTGAGKVQWNEITAPLEAGHHMWMPPGLLHRLEDDAGSPMVLHVVCFKTEAFPEVPSIGAGIAYVTGGEKAGMIWERVRELGHTSRTKATQLRLRALAYGLLDEVARNMSCKYPTRELKPAFERVRRHAGEMQRHPYREGTLDDAARSAGLSRRRFSALFREVTGGTWLELQRKARVEYATQLIRTSRMDLTTIAFESGFQNMSTFHRAFRDVTGHAPSSCRVRDDVSP